MKHHLTETHEHHSEIHNFVLFSQSISLIRCSDEDLQLIHVEFQKMSGQPHSILWINFIDGIKFTSNTSARSPMISNEMFTFFKHYLC